jgi:hypothetical protein
MLEIRTSPKKARKPQARTLLLREAILSVASEYERMSVRQLFYQLVARGHIDKTENQYKRVAANTVEMRRDGTLPYTKIVDGSRVRRSHEGYSSLNEMFENQLHFYRQNAWLDHPIAVEIWCEKDALSGIIEPICAEYGVTYVAARGFSSVTLQYESAMAMAQRKKPTYIYYFGDHDASGRCMSDKLGDQLRVHGADVRLIRMGLDPPQIERYRLPTRPGKTTDSRHTKFAATYGDECVELDALPPNLLSHMVRRCINQHVDHEARRRAKLEEQAARETLANFSKTLWQPGTVYRFNDE